jgi:lysyl-tRNA synthetase, class I
VSLPSSRLLPDRPFPRLSPPDGLPATKLDMRAWFVLLYRLLIGEDTGPRPPTLLLALGQERVRALLGA